MGLALRHPWRGLLILLAAWITRSRGATLAAVAVAVTSVAIIASPTPSPPAGGSGTANLFVVAGGGACTRSATPIDFASSASPDRRCGDVSTAFSASSAGDTAIIKGGSYPTLGVASSVTRSPAVTMSVAAGETMTLTGGIGAFCASGLTIDGTTGAGATNAQGIVQSIRGNAGADGMTVGLGACGITSSNLTLKGIYLNNIVGDGGTDLYLEQCNNVTLSDITIDGSTNGDDGIQVSGFDPNICNNVTIDRVNLFDYSCTGTNGDHQDFMQILSGSNIVVRNSIWIGLHCILVSGDPSGAQGWFVSGGFSAGTNMVLENSVIADVQDSAGSFPVAVYTNSGIVMRNNTIIGTIKTETSPNPPSNVTFVNNIADSSCSGSIDSLFSFKGTGQYGNNVLKNDCGHATDLVAPSFNAMFVNPGAFDFRLVAGSFAINKGNATTATTTDYEGGARDGSPDAGYDEFGAP